MSHRRGLAIRAAGAADAAALSELFASAGYHLPTATLADRLAAISAGAGTALAAWEWGPPSGVVVLHWYAALHSERPIAQIDVLLVAAEARRRGLGRLLVKAASQSARLAGCGAIELSAATQDAQTAAFCQATGFATTGLRFSRALRRKA